MNILLVISSIIFPIIMIYIHYKIEKSPLIFNSVAVISTVIFGSIASVSVYQVIVDDKVFMTTIHKVFLNPLFLITGAYLGVYIIYRLLLITIQERDSKVRES